MSKYVKDLLKDDLRRQLEGVSDALVMNVIGLNSDRTARLRQALRSKNIHLQVVKNSLARRATEGTPLAPAFEGMQGSCAIVWGEMDIVSLAKEVVGLSEAKEFDGFRAKGGAMDGARLSPEQVKEVSTWPTREEQIAMLVGQMLSPGAGLASQLTSAGGALASQIKQKAEGEGGEAAAETAPAEAAAG